MSICQKDHRYDTFFERLPRDQGDFGRHKCAGCAYKAGYDAGIIKKTTIDLEAEINKIEHSQAGSIRHKSPVVAFAQGYTDGLFEYYQNQA